MLVGNGEAKMRRLILARHALPVVDAAIPSAQWSLSAEGRAKSAQFGELLAAYKPDRVVTSAEPKAAETGAIMAAGWGLSATSRPGLHEHDRSNEGFVEDFAVRVREFFVRSEDRVFGTESAAQVTRRFARAVDGILAEEEGLCMVCVAHGTVISLFAQERSGIDAFTLWSALEMPCALVFSLPDFSLETTEPIALPAAGELD